MRVRGPGSEDDLCRTRCTQDGLERVLVDVYTLNCRRQTEAIGMQLVSPWSVAWYRKPGIDVCNQGIDRSTKGRPRDEQCYVLVISLLKRYNNRKDEGTVRTNTIQKRKWLSHGSTVVVEPHLMSSNCYNQRLLCRVISISIRLTICIDLRLLH